MITTTGQTGHANFPLAHFLGSLVPMTSLAIARYDALAGDYCGWREHAEIVDAVERGDVTAAERLMTRHLDRLEEACCTLDRQSAKNRVAD